MEPYTIEVERARDLVRMTLRGFWDVAMVERFAEAQQRAVRMLRCPPGAHLALCHSAGPPQSQAVIAAMQALVLNAPRKARRFALVPSGAISELQGRRVLLRPGMALCPDVASAEAWLFAEDEGADAA